LTDPTITLALERFTSFGDLLKFLRRRTGLTQRELSIQVGYSHAQISRLELNQRPPDLATVVARFVQALDLEQEPEIAARLIELAAAETRDVGPTGGAPPFKGLRRFEEAMPSYSSGVRRSRPASSTGCAPRSLPRQTCGSWPSWAPRAAASPRSCGPV